MNIKQITGLSLRKVIENATAGATSAASVATNIGSAATKGTIGVGFDASGDKGIYQGKPKKQTSKASSVIRR
jgi:hypothetical protein